MTDTDLDWLDGQYPPTAWECIDYMIEKMYEDALLDIFGAIHRARLEILDRQYPPYTIAASDICGGASDRYLEAALGRLFYTPGPAVRVTSGIYGAWA